MPSSPLHPPAPEAKLTEGVLSALEMTNEEKTSKLPPARRSSGSLFPPEPYRTGSTNSFDPRASTEGTAETASRHGGSVPTDRRYVPQSDGYVPVRSSDGARAARRAVDLGVQL